MPVDLFIGLVTHPRSRFADATTVQGLLSQAAQGASDAGLVVETAVCDQDLLAPGALPLDRSIVLSSIQAELEVERRWRRYINGGQDRWFWGVFFAARRVWRVVRLAPPWGRGLTANEPGPRMVTRLANIELAHMWVMAAALKSGARWALILEDDADTSDPRAFAHELAAFLRDSDDRGQPATMNLSESFTPAQLGVEHLLSPVSQRGNAVDWRLFSAAQPLTNTVCAVLYRRDYLARLLRVMQSIPLSPVIPIDFKVNEAVMRLAPTLASGDCWVASPAPLNQRSGVPNVRR